MIRYSMGYLQPCPIRSDWYVLFWCLIYWLWLECNIHYWSNVLKRLDISLFSKEALIKLMWIGNIANEQDIEFLLDFQLII